jgi:LCP family protein required for cell wall assembly
MTDSPRPPRNGDGLDGLRDLRPPKTRRQRRRRPLRRWPRRILIAANVLVALSLLGAASAYGYVNWRLGQITRIPILHLTITGKGKQSKVTDGSSSSPPFTMLVVGSDTRSLSGGDCSDAGAGDTGGQRSDSIILVRVIPKLKKLALLSIPRDTLVPIPGEGTTRINSAFNSGNPNLLVQVLNSDFGIEVNHFAEFNFQTFCDVANAIGGVEQYFPAPARDYNSGLGVGEGCINLTGGEALAFVRSREYQYFLNGQWNDQLYPESDLARIQRQQAFVKASVKKAEQVAPSNPLTLNSLIAGVTKNLTLDNNFSDKLILSLAKTFHSADLSVLPEYTYPTVNSAQVSGALDPQTAAGQTTIALWLNGGVTPPVAATTTSSAPPVTTVNPAGVNIEVANGSGVSGQAGAARSALAGLGYPASLSYSSVSYDHANSVIDYAPDSLAAATQLQHQLVGGNAVLQEDASLTGTNYSLELITGQTYNGVVGSSTGGSSSSTSSTATTVAPSPAFVGSATIEPDSSSTFMGNYIPPGRVTGQAIPNCGT